MAKRTVQKTTHIAQKMHEVHFASFDKRLIAFALDIIIIGICSSFLKNLSLSDLSPLVSILYFVTAWVKFDGKTLGNKVMRISVQREDGKDIDLSTGIIRSIGYSVSFLSLGIGFLWALFDTKKQGWHDKIAKTIVVVA